MGDEMKSISIKVCMCGDPNVGKTSLVRRYVHSKYDDNYVSTLGTLVSKKSVISKKNDTTVNMMIWDISGQAEFKRIHESAFTDSKGALAVCDISRSETANNLKTWMSQLNNFAGDIPVIILANKEDLKERYTDDYDMVKASLTAFDNVQFFTSAKTGDNVEQVFEALADAVSDPERTKNNVTNESSYSLTSEDPKSPTEFLDYMAVLFSKVLADQEMGMHIVRKQVKDEGFDFRRITKDDATALIDRLVNIIKEHRGERVANHFRNELLKALDGVKD